MKKVAAGLSCLLMMAALLASAQTADSGYQMARVVSFEKVASSEQHPENADQYKIAMRLGETVYLCRANGPIATFIDWAPGKEYPAKLDTNGKVLLVKNTDGQVIQMTVASKKTPK